MEGLKGEGMLLDCRAQVSIETLLIALFILTMSISVLSYFFTINDSTTAIELLKVRALQKVDGLDSQAFIEKIDYTVSGSTISLKVTTNPETLNCPELGLDESLRDLITDSTGFTAADFTLNNGSCP